MSWVRALARAARVGVQHCLLSHARLAAALRQVLPAIAGRRRFQGPGYYDDGDSRLIRIWLANRGIWDALPGAGPTVPVPAAPADVTRYLEAYSELLAQLR